MAASQKKILWTAVFLILLVRAFSIFSFPLNFGGDGSIYYTMIVEKQSNLLMAQGYPFLLMFPYHFLRWVVSFFISIPEDLSYHSWWMTSKDWLVGSRTLEEGISWASVFQNHDFILFQHSIELAALYCGFQLVKKYFGFSVSVFFLLLYGLSPSSLEDCSSCRPEWLQGAIFVFWVYFADRISDAGGTRKWILYSLLGLLCAAGFLVKFNGLPVFLAFFALLFFREWKARDSSRVRKLGLKMAFSGGAACALVWAFIAGYHLPTTGTAKLTVNSWILADKTFQFLPTLSLEKENGLHAKRVLAMKRGLPISKKNTLEGSYFRKLGLLEKEREPYRKKLGWVLKAPERDLDAYLASKGSDSLFEQQSLLSIGYYVGLEEYGHLLKNMYIEAVKHYPFAFLEDTANEFFRSFAMKERSHVYHPLWEEVQAGRSQPKTSAFGFVKFLWPADRGICYHDNTVWLPGVWFFTALSKYWPATFVIWAGAFAALFFALKKTRSQKDWIVIYAMALLLLFVWGSNMINTEFRIKDYRCIHLFVTALAARGIWQIGCLGRETLRKMRIYE